MGILAGDPRPPAQGLPAKGGSLKTSHTRRCHEALNVKDQLLDYFHDHPEARGRHWHVRKFSSKLQGQRWAQWLIVNREDVGMCAPDWAIRVRAGMVYITLRDAEGNAWRADGTNEPQPLWYRKEQERLAQLEQGAVRPIHTNLIEETS